MSDGAVVLIVEDSEDDLFFLRRAWEKAGVKAAIQVAVDGVEAIDALRVRGPGRPTHVLLDLKLPRKSGFEVLEWIRQDAEVRTLPVIVLTSSGEQSDLESARKLGIDDYLIKPVHLPDLIEVVRSIAERWRLAKSETADRR